MNVNNLFLFLRSKLFWWNILAIFAMGILIIIGTLLFLNSYTDHGESEIVPDVKGLTVEEGIPLLENKGLRYEIVDSIYQEDAIPGVILGQLPKPASRVKRNRIVFITVNASSPLTLAMPDVRDMSQRQAIAILKGSGFKIGNIRYVPSEFSNLIIEMSYSGRNLLPGQKLPIGCVIDLVVGQGYSSEMIATPDLTSLSQEEATTRAHEESFTIGGIFYDEQPTSEEDKNSYMVYKQNPQGKELAPKGKGIDIYLTKDKNLIKKESEKRENGGTPVKIESDDESWF